MIEYIKRDDAVKLVAIILAAEAQIQGYNVNVSDCLSEAAAWVRDYCPEVEREGDIVRCKECRFGQWHEQAEAYTCTAHDQKTEQTAECPFDDAIPCEWACTEYGKCKYKTEPTISKMEQVDEPQTEEHCENCRHKDECEGATYEYKNTEWWCLAYAPIDEPQTEETEMDEYYKDHDEFYDCAWK